MNRRMPTQALLSLPPRMAADFAQLEPARACDWFAASDPLDKPLGSGGGTMHLLNAAWRATGKDAKFSAWLNQSRKLMIHAGGQSRRLPAYAPVGKAFIPLPAARWALGERLDQTLLDLQAPAYLEMLERAPARTRVMVASGDVALRWGGRLPSLPDADVIVVGMWVRPETASHHGVFFCPRGQPGQLAFMLQKPAPERIRELSAEHVFLIDTGVWMLSERAVNVLRAKCAKGQRYELYGEFGLALGTKPTARDREIGGLTCAVLPLPHGEFYHFGTSRALIESASALQNRVLDQTKFGPTTAKPHPDQYTQNSVISAAIGPANHTLWIENSHIPAGWELSSEHVLTGVPPNNWKLKLAPGACLDFVPVGKGRVCVRAYRMDDTFAGEAQTTPRFPVVEAGKIDGAFLESLFTQPVTGELLSAQELMQRADLAQLQAQRAANRAHVLAPMARNHQRSVFYSLDLAATANLFAATKQPVPAMEPTEPLKQVQERMFRAAVLRARRQRGAEKLEAEAFALLREAIVRETEFAPVTPTRRVLDDQIVWGRSPVRLDLAGGWTDTPPYCLQHGGRVVNVAVNLNGQPPIQVFARVSEKPELVVRSIDLGVEERIRTYAELSRYDQVGSGFTIAKAAFALAGFLPRFNATGGAKTLEKQLRAFGGGIEVSLLCAVPKGSGLGTSSILAATLLGTLSDLCGLGWDEYALSQRTLALEQMLTTGGGWQDQVGGLTRGVKLIETEPGLLQKPVIHWLPEHLFGPTYANKTLLLYYTGLTRVAKGILKEIVRGMFLNSREHLTTIARIGENAEFAAAAIGHANWNALAEAVDTSWRLNQQLDRGTNPAAVQEILAPVASHLAAAKLLGAGGGGYLLMLAKDDEAARSIRHQLTTNPPNSRARFVDLSLSTTGFQVTRS